MIYRILIACVAALSFTAPAALAKEVGRAEIHVNVTDIFGARQFCAEETVFAIPVTPKSTGVMSQFYPSTEKGFASIYATPELIIRREGTTYVGGSAPDATQLFRRKFEGQKRGKCNAADTAVFEKLPAGTYYLIIPVFWQRDDVLSRKMDVKLRGGGRNEIFVKIPTNYRGGTFLVRTEIIANETTEFNLENEIVDTAPE